MKKLTAMHLKILDYIRQYIDEYGFPPSVRELAEGVGLRSPSSVQRHLDTLEQRGYLHRAGRHTRAIVLTNMDKKPAGVPLLGTVAAGEPILAVEDATDYIGFDVGDDAEYFALIIKGQSMIKAGILDGDTVIVRRQPAAESGEIVIALIDDSATCKRLLLSQKSVWLIPENDNYIPIDGSDAKILGKVTAVIRRYN